MGRRNYKRERIYRSKERKTRILEGKPTKGISRNGKKKKKKKINRRVLKYLPVSFLHTQPSDTVFLLTLLKGLSQVYNNKLTYNFDK